jgi:hypothetical protein
MQIGVGLLSTGHSAGRGPAPVVPRAARGWWQAGPDTGPGLTAGTL